MNKVISTLCLLSLTATVANAQTKKAPAKTKSATQSSSDKNTYISTANGLEYAIIEHGKGARKPVMGDYISLHMITKIGDSVLFSTRQVLNDQPAEIQVGAPVRGDVAEGFTYMVPGDSAIFRMSVDTLMKLPNFTSQPWMKPGTGQKLYFYTRLVTVKTSAEKETEMKAATEKQKTIDDDLLQAYFKTKNLKPSKTESGLYYTIEKQGTGAQAAAGDTVVVNYTGKTMDGKEFDSNVLPQFGHQNPFEFMVGRSQVIKGWDEAFMLFKTGTKGTIYIPSGLAYGPNSPDPSRIPANGILVFDIELKNVKKPTDRPESGMEATAPAKTPAPKAGTSKKKN